MRLLFAILFTLVSFVCQAQTAPPIPMGSKLYEFKNGARIDSAAFMPRRDTTNADPTMIAPGMFQWRPADQSFYGRDSTGWRKFVLEGTLSDYVPTTRLINTTSPLSGGGNLSTDRTLSIANAQADGENKGAATFRSDHFDDDGMGAISLDTVNGPFYTRRYASDTVNQISFAGWALSYGGYHAAEGSLVPVNGDTILNVFRLDTAFTHAGVTGLIVKRFSYDNGLTWTSPTVLYNSQYDDRNLVAEKLDNNRIVVLFRRYNGSATVDFGRIYSDDGGATWSAYSTITVSPTASAFFGHIVKAADGAWHVPAYASGSCYMYKSTDNGLSWTNQATMFSFSDGRNPTETVVAYVNGGRMIALSRDDTAIDSAYFQHVSSDNGNTWTYAGRTNMNRSLRYVNRNPPSLLFDSARNIVIATSGYRNYQTFPAPYTPRQDSQFVYINRPDDVFSSPTSWSMKVGIGRAMPSNLVQYGYPWITKLNNGNYLGVITDEAITGYSSGDSYGEEFTALYQFDLNFVDNYLSKGVGQSRYLSTIPVYNRTTGLFDAKSDQLPISNNADSTSFLRLNNGLIISSAQRAGNRETFAVRDTTGSPILRIQRNNRLIYRFPSISGLGPDVNLRGEVRLFNGTTGLESARFDANGRLGIGVVPTTELGIKAAGNTAITLYRSSTFNLTQRFIDTDGSTIMGELGILNPSNTFELAAYGKILALTATTQLPIQFRSNGVLAADMRDTAVFFHVRAKGIDPVQSNDLVTRNFADASYVATGNYNLNTVTTAGATTSNNITTGNITIGKATPTLSFINSSPVKAWDMGGNGSDFLLNETGVATRLRLLAGGNVGVGVSPTSRFHTTGSNAVLVSSISANATLGEHNIVEIATGGITITLPTASTCSGRIYKIRNRTASTCTITSVDIDGVGTTTFPANTYWEIYSNGSAWRLLSRSN